MSHEVCKNLAMQVLRQFMLLPEGEIQELDGLARRVHLAAAEKQEEEELLQVGQASIELTAIPGQGTRVALIMQTMCESEVQISILLT